MKFSEGALWATLEAENLYDCEGGGLWSHEAIYDAVRVAQRRGVLPSEPQAPASECLVHAGESLELSLADLVRDADDNIDPSTLSVPDNPTHGQLTVDRAAGGLRSAAAGISGETGFHVVACDEAPWSYCAGAWVIANLSCA